MNRDWESLTLRRRALTLESAMLRIELQTKREALQARLGQFSSPLALGGAGAFVAMALRFRAWRWVLRAIPLVGVLLKVLRSRKSPAG